MRFWPSFLSYQGDWGGGSCDSLLYLCCGHVLCADLLFYFLLFLIPQTDRNGLILVKPTSKVFLILDTSLFSRFGLEVCECAHFFCSKIFRYFLYIVSYPWLMKASGRTWVFLIHLQMVLLSFQNPLSLLLQSSHFLSRVKESIIFTKTIANRKAWGTRYTLMCFPAYLTSYLISSKDCIARRLNWMFILDPLPGCDLLGVPAWLHLHSPVGWCSSPGLMRKEEGDSEVSLTEKHLSLSWGRVPFLGREPSSPSPPGRLVGCDNFDLTQVYCYLGY